MKRLILVALAILCVLMLGAAAFGQVVIGGFDTSTQPGGTNNFGTSPLPPATVDANATVGGLTRGAGVSTTGTGAQRGMGGVGFNTADAAASIAANKFFTFTVKANSGYILSLSSIDPFNYRRSGTGPVNALVQYQIDSGAFVDIATVSFPVTTTTGGSAGPVNLSAITALQNVPDSSTVTFRIVPYGASGATGTFYFFDVANSTANDLAVNGTLDVVAPPAIVEFGTTIYEEDESQTAFVIVERSGDLSGTTTVDYSTQAQNPFGITATGGASCTTGVDYIHVSGTLTFDPEESAEQIQIQLCGDVVTDPDEYFTVYLSNVTNGTLGENSTAQVYINDTANQFLNTEPIFIGTSGDPDFSSIVVTDAPTNIGSIRVTLYDFEHIDADDVDVLLVGPQGQKFLLMADAGGENGLVEGATITFDDSAGQVLPDNSQIFSGRYEPTTWEPGQPSFNPPAPEGPYIEPGSTVGGEVTMASVFGGTNPNGTWILYVRDDNNTFRLVGSDGLIAGGWGLQLLAPTAAAVSISGQVRSGKTPISGATVSITGGDLTQPLIARTNNFGFYTFEGLRAGQIYVVTVAAKRYTFQQPSIVLNPDDNVTGADFEAEER